ncbi:D-alanyl-lipoteichoic acid biosynthesis protein DltD [Staphylococcus lutrae]|uniref:D-alanyl-lipoteichoic acid biosynthesis protein DltD n=1 Tax=Staphylococcus lutrae TaxID=155085 RepID=A0AAC9RUP0_9STAP|nr:D-alanyl-lipoteichoic acid biosynthesis protein DltD [Staphylococcus lutrae]ARJ51459.1 D-alanyl-lipoteichoic acid biosynthesis protein DltD [Staphylococcus lutrae]PNZ37983.1 D-alanyl-lipoteichoic acid biosynthesis protein DltD [Staphylococcus lutrae]
MKLKQPYIIAFLASILLFAIFILLPAKWFVPPHLANQLPKYQVSNDSDMLKGQYLQEAMVKDPDYYPVYGSSELTKSDPFQPAILLKGHSKRLFYIGTGGSTDLIQLMTLGAQFDHLKNKKMTIIVSPQWFTHHGLTEVNYQGRSSQLQINSIFNNPNISQDIKKRLAHRLLHFKENQNNDYLKSYAKTDHPDGHFLNPLYTNHLEKMEALQSYLPLHHLSDLPKLYDNSKKQDLNWKALDKKAYQYGASQSRSNPYEIKDEYWHKLKHKKSIGRQHEFRLKSVEYDDLSLLIDTMNEAGADVQYILIPVNGKWYDHIDIPRDRRMAVNQKIVKTIEDHHGQVVDLSKNDYTPYYMSDAVHIGWRGWVDVSQHIQEHMAQ